MPRVLRIINRLNLGGPTYNAAYLTKFLQPEFDTLLVSGMKDEEEESSEFIVKQLALNPVYVPDMYRELNPFKDYKSYYRLRRLIDEFKPDIVHTHAAKAGAVGRLAAIHCGVKTIIHTFHGHVFHSYFSPLKTNIFLSIERYLASRTTKIIALSTSQRNELVQKYHIAPKEKFSIIPLGFDLSKFETDQARKRNLFREAYNISEDEIAIGITGRLVPIKNHSLFLRALKLVSQNTSKKLRAFIIGGGECLPELEKLASDLGLKYNHSDPKEKNILTFTGWIKDIDVSNAGLDIVALTSLNEGTPVSLIEAQASSKAIVSTNVGGIEDIVKPGQTALLSDSKSAESLANNLLRVIEDSKLREYLALNGNNHVKNKFSYTRLCSDMATLYNSLHNNHA
jgi:glycosyltransferase involved in cell wall biosynthesis